MEEIKKFKAPNLDEPSNLALIEEDMEKYAGDYLVILAGYFGSFESAWALL